MLGSKLIANVLTWSPPQATTVPPSITFKWRKCKDRQEGMYVSSQPVTLNGKLYIKGGELFISDEEVLEYTPGHDQWTALPPPPVKSFTIATLQGQLLAVGGEDKSTGKTKDKKTSVILTFNTHSKQWVQTYPAMSTALSTPAVIGYKDHLIVAGGCNSHNNRIPAVNILDTTSNEWKTAQPLPSIDYYYTVLIKDTMYLVGWDTQTVLRAHVPTLISGAESGVWETLPDTKYAWSSTVTLLTVGGRDKSYNFFTSIRMYDPTTKHWIRVGDLPELLDFPCCIIINSELFVFHCQSVHVSTVTLV